MIKQWRNKLSLWKLLTITDWQVIWLTTGLVVVGHGAAPWDWDSDALCTHLNVCSFVPDNDTAAGHWCVHFRQWQKKCTQMLLNLHQHSDSHY